MKQSILFLLSILFLTACRKDQAAGIRTQITGAWEWVTFSGYPFINQALPAGNGRIIIFGSNGLFERKAHDTFILRGSYNLQERKDCYGNEQHVFLNATDSGFINNYSLDIINARLYISSPNCFADGGSSVWRKL